MSLEWLERGIYSPASLMAGVGASAPPVRGGPDWHRKLPAGVAVRSETAGLLAGSRARNTPSAPSQGLSAPSRPNNPSPAGHVSAEAPGCPEGAGPEN